MKKKETICNKMITYLISIMIVVHPLLLKWYAYDAGIYDYAWMSNDGVSVDFFLYCKMIFFIACYGVLTILFLALLYSDKISLKIPKEFFLLGAYLLLVVLSTLTSEYNRFSFSGSFEQFENFWCLIGYVIVIAIIYLTITKEHQYQILIKAFVVGAAMIGIIGVSQFFGCDLIMTDFVKHLIAPAEYADGLSLTFYRGMVYTTLYNPDYVGLYVALMLPILFASLRLMKEKIWKVVAAIDIVMLIISVIGAEASSGIIAVWVSVIVYVTVNIKQIVENKKLLLVIALLGIGVLSTVGLKKLSMHLRFVTFVDQTVTEQEVIEDSEISGGAAEVIEDNEISAGEAETNVAASTIDGRTRLDSFVETDEYVEFVYDGSIFRESISVEEGYAKLVFTDENGNPLDASYDEASQYYTITDSRFEGINSISGSIDENTIGFITTIDGKEWRFAYGTKSSDDTVSYYHYTNHGKFDKSVISDSWIIPESKWGMLNGRGFIWAKTLGLLKHHIILGTGADSFILVFPHNDYAAMYRSGYENMIMSKPHCAYLQIATQTGVLSLLCLLAFYLIYFIKNCKRLFTHKEGNALSLLQNAFLAGTIGFLVSSIANDSTICVTPIFCIIMGLALGLNRMEELS